MCLIVVVVSDLVPDYDAGLPVSQLLHEVPRLDPAHGGEVDAVDGHDLVAHQQRLGLVRRSSYTVQK